MEFKNFLFNGKARKLILWFFDFICFVAVDICYFFLAVQTGEVFTVQAGWFVYNSLCLYICILISRLIFRVYTNVWRYTNTSAYLFIVVADYIGAFISVLLSYFLLGALFDGFYIGIWHGITVTSLTIVFALASRFIYRLAYKYYNKTDKRINNIRKKINIGIIGAGQIGAYLVAELQSSPSSDYVPRCFIDISSQKIGNRIANLPVYSEEDAESVIDKYGITEVVFAISNIDQETTKGLWERYSAFGCKIKTYDIPLHNAQKDDEKSPRVIRDFAIEDLLFRQPLDINKYAELNFYKDKTILVTGGGGSIGSELCRQIAKCEPKKLIVLDIYENNAYDIEQELKRKYGEKLDFVVEIGSVRDIDRLDCIFSYYRPQVVFHAAAHKHVPLMQHSGAEAIKNNVMGTFNAANMAEKYGAQKFILISTDKAVNPTNIMGASKRLCEMVVQCRTDSATSFAAVRFGNVLGSNGSVIPLFRRQIMAGGPVTITDKRIIRYFMTIPEASQLVMLAGAKAKKGELFVLDMGRPVKIYDLAVNMIKLMGYNQSEIKIEEIGLRPGEKLYEELLMKNETLVKTDNKMIFIEKDKPYSREEINEKLDILLSAVESSKTSIGSDIIKNAIKQTVPTFFEPEELNNKEKLKEYLKENSTEKKAK